MATFTPSLSGVKGRALFSLLFMAPLVQAADTTAAKDGETLTVTADPNTTAEATNGYQPLNTSTATLTNMPMLDIPQVVNTVSDKVLEDQHATTLDEALYNVSNVVQTNTLGGTQDAFVRRGFGANRDGSIMTNGLRTVLPRSFNAATERVEVLKGPASTLYGILDPGGLINVVTKRPEKTFGGSFPPPPPALAAAPDRLMLPARLTARVWRIA
jgi:iron complex outermembrane receptor protein